MSGAVFPGGHRLEKGIIKTPPEDFLRGGLAVCTFTRAGRDGMKPADPYNYAFDRTPV